MRKFSKFPALPFIDVVLMGVLWSFALASLMSCAPTVSHQTAMNSLNNSVSCCTSLAQFKFDQLVGGEEISFRLDESSEAFAFKTGKSYYKMFRLPERELPYSIKISSFDLDNSVDNDLVFYPQIALLDDRFVIIRKSSPASFSLSIAGFEERVPALWSWRFKLEGYVPIDSPNEKYILIYTTDTLMRGAIPYTRPITYPKVIPMGFETVVIRHAPFARLHMEMAPYTIETARNFDLQTQRDLAQFLVGDGVIIPGERIGQLRIGGNIHDFTKILGKVAAQGPGSLYQNSTLYSWPAIGLSLIADNKTGALLWVSVATGPASPWGEVTTREGLRLGSAEQDVLSAMRVPPRTFADNYGKSFYYEDKGVMFTLLNTGRLAQKVNIICIF